MFLKIIFLVFCVFFCNCERILVYIGAPFPTHHYTFHNLWRTLSLRHQLTIITKFPIGDKSLVNITEIVLPCDNPDFGSNFNIIKLTEFCQDLLYDDLTNPKVFRLLKDENVGFDLVISETMMFSPLSLGWRFNCPLIGFSSLDIVHYQHVFNRNPKHSYVNPDYNTPVIDYKNLSFKERIYSTFYRVLQHLLYNIYFLPTEQKNVEGIFGKKLPNLGELSKNVTLFFLNINKVFHNVPPLYNKFITIGEGVQLKDLNLTSDLQEYLDKSKNGVIYFSLGSNVKGHLLNDTTKREILNAFSELPYDILMKMDSELVDVPKNVKIQKWMPQQDILRHPKIKLFISQGGLQSLQESITNGVPLVGIPFFGDQISNVYRMVKKGYGVRVDKKEITKENLKAAILEVIENPKYREKAKEMGELLHDEPMTSLEKAVWWIEYVIRHKGAKHLRSPAVDMPFYIYYMLDVIGFMLAVVLLTLFITYKTLKFVIRKIFCKKVKAKRE